nr:MAG: nonstructural protein [Microviridae sp.]
MRIFTVHDSKAEAHLPPFYMKTKAEAMRAFESTVQDKESQFHKYPSDFTLLELGEFDEISASICTHAKPLILANAAEYKQ